MREIHFTSEVWAAMMHHVRIGYPQEICGLLLGRQNASDMHITEAYPVKNMALKDQRHHFYLMNPQEFLNIQRYADTHSLSLIGIYHSHPDHPAEPSQTDLELAWENMSYVIIKIDHQGNSQIRSWRLINHQFVEEKIVIPS